MTLALVIPEISKAVWNLKDGHAPFQGRFVIDRLGQAKVNLPTKFEVPNFARCRNIKARFKM